MPWDWNCSWVSNTTPDAIFTHIHSDPIEVEAIGRLFADAKTPSAPLLMGSIKSNMGHSEPSSGIAGVMKAVLAIERGLIPPTIGLQTLNPNIDLKEGRLKIVTETMPWPDLPIRRASINSFGYGGSNAHVSHRYSHI